MPPITTRFTSTLFRSSEGAGAWTFVAVPERHAPPVQHGWGRTGVVATVDGHRWRTSVWREKSGRTLLPVPKAVRGAKGDGDRVRVVLEFNV
jgi:hypothetical protein